MSNNRKPFAMLIMLVVAAMLVMSCGGKKNDEAPAPQPDPTPPIGQITPPKPLTAEGYWLLSKDTVGRVVREITENSPDFLVYRFLNGKARFSIYPDKPGSPRGDHYCPQDQDYSFDGNTKRIHVVELGQNCEEDHISLVSLSDNTLEIPYHDPQKHEDHILTFTKIDEGKYNQIMKDKFE